MKITKPILLTLLAITASTLTLFAQATVGAPDTLVYRRVAFTPLKAYVFKPVNTTGPRPAILLFHGGAWRLGDGTWTNGEAKQFAELGMVAISIDYRLANDGLSPVDGVEDACAAFAWARKNAEKLGIDPKRIAGFGISAGGHLVAAVATIPSIRGTNIPDDSRPNAIILYSAALNMAKDPYFDNLMTGSGDPAAYSPSEYISNKLPPTVIIQGQQDSIVYAKDAVAFRDAAVEAGATCKLYMYPGVGHLLTRNLKVQYKDFDADPAFAADAFKRQVEFLKEIGYLSK